MKIIKIITLPMVLLSANAFAQQTSVMEVSAVAEGGCQFQIDGAYHFGVIDFTESTKAINFPLNFAPHAEIATDLSIQCSPGTSYTVEYTTEERLSPLMETNGFKKIEGVILNNESGSEDFLLSYIYNVEWNAMLHGKPIVGTAIDGNVRRYPLLIGLQNPLERGYRYPSAGVYSGETTMTLTF